jgi:hypothetical protein
MVSHSRMTPYFGRTAQWILVLAISFAGPVTAFGQGDDVPRPVVDLKPGTANYKIRLEANGKVLMMDVTRVTKSQKGSWVVSETTSFPGHVQSDEITVDKKTLIIHKRLFRDGDAVADLQFAGHHVTGMLSEGKEKLAVDADAGGIVFADGGGGEDVLAALPLAQGYTVEFRNFNIGSQQVKMLQLRVMDSETVSVPAGTFDTWKVLITSLDGGTDTYGLWVDKRTHRVVKMAISIPNMGDALATIELVK